MQNSMVVFTFSFLTGITPFLAKLVQKNQNYNFKLKFVAETNSNMQNLIAVFTLFVLDWKYRYWTNLFQSIKIVS